MLLRSRVLWISLGVSLACHASLMLALRLSYLTAKENPYYDYLPVRVLMVEGQDVSVTQTARDTFSVPAPPSPSDTSLDDEKAEKKQEKPKPPKEKKARKAVEKPKQPPEKAEPKPAPPTKTAQKKRKAKGSSSPAQGGAARRPVPVGMQGQEKQSLRLMANPPVRMPARAWYEGRFGTTWVRVFVSATGRVERVEIAQSCGHRDLDEVALRHVRTQFRFAPAVVEGKPVAARCQVYVEFPRSR